MTFSEPAIRFHDFKHILYPWLRLLMVDLASYLEVVVGEGHQTLQAAAAAEGEGEEAY